MDFSSLLPKIVSLQSAIQEKSPNLVTELDSIVKTAFGLEETDKKISLLFKLYKIINDDSNLLVFNKHKLRKLVEEINVDILTLIRDSLGKQPNLQPFSFLKGHFVPTKKNKKKTVLFTLLASLGVVFAAIEGASIMQMLLSTFTALQNIPALILVPAQILFAVITAAAFYAFEVSTIGKKLGINSLQIGAIFKYYNVESKLFKDLFALSGKAMNVCQDQNEYMKINHFYTELNDVYQLFEKKVTKSKEVIQPSRVKDITKKSLTLGAGTFCGIIAALGAQPIIATTIPIILGASLAAGPLGLAVTVTLMVLCGLTTAGIFWLIEQKCDKVVDKVCGTPTKKIQKLTAREHMIQLQKIENSQYNRNSATRIAQASENRLLKQTLEQQKSQYHEEVFEKKHKVREMSTESKPNLTKNVQPKTKKNLQESSVLTQPIVVS